MLVGRDAPCALTPLPTLPPHRCSPSREPPEHDSASQADLPDALSESLLTQPMTARSNSATLSVAGGAGGGGHSSRASSFSLPPLPGLNLAPRDGAAGREAGGAGAGGGLLQEVAVVEPGPTPCKPGSPPGKQNQQQQAQQQQQGSPSSATRARQRAAEGAGGGPRSPRSPTRSSPSRFSLRDVADWSYPASTLGTPTSQRAG